MATLVSSGKSPNYRNVVLSYSTERDRFLFKT